MLKIVGVLAVQGDFKEHIEALNELEGVEARPVKTREQIQACDALVIPGGESTTIGKLMERFELDKPVREMVEAGKPVFAICHAPWVLIEADVVRGRKVTSFPSLQTDLVNAGAEWVDSELVSDDGVFTSRRPDDLPAFCEAIVGAARGAA